MTITGINVILCSIRFKVVIFYKLAAMVVVEEICPAVADVNIFARSICNEVTYRMRIKWQASWIHGGHHKNL